MPEFTVITDRRTFTVEADDAGHAERIVMGRDRPVSVPPAPRPAEERTGSLGALVPTAAWMAWYREHRSALWDQRLHFGREILVEIKEGAHHGT